jgi:hypothetical protein
MKRMYLCKKSLMTSVFIFCSWCRVVIKVLWIDDDGRRGQRKAASACGFGFAIF